MRSRQQSLVSGLGIKQSILLSGFNKNGFKGCFGKIFILIISATFIGHVRAGDKEPISLIDCENPDEWEGKVLLNTEIKRNGKYSFETFGKYPTRTDYKYFIPIDPKKTYTLTGYMRSLDPDEPASGFMGLYMFDENKKLITISSVASYPETESELVEPITAGSSEMIVKKNDMFLSFEHWAVAFNAQADYADLPNFDLSPKGVDVKVEADKMRLVLSSPVKKDYKAGTKIRLHSPWGAPFYWAAQGWMPGEWKRFSVSLKGIAPHGNPTDKFWKGTKYVKPFFWFANYNRLPEPGARLLVDDFTFIESDVQIVEAGIEQQESE